MSKAPRKFNGSRKHPLYWTWTSMINRCYYPSTYAYPWYGGKGIEVCPQWFDFLAWLKDVGERPEGYSFDRIDVNKNYEPGNVRWVTPREQKINTGKRKDNTSGYFGVTKRGKYWAGQISVHGDMVNLGHFKTAELAALAYNEAAIKYHGPLAKQNVLETSDEGASLV